MKAFAKSPWVLHYDASSCNGCDIEVVASLTPLYDVERLGVINTGNPKHADIFLVTGSVNAQNLMVLRNLYEQMPEPRVVAAVGICATSGCVFRECYNVMGGWTRCCRWMSTFPAAPPGPNRSSTGSSRPWRYWKKSTPT